MLLLIRRSIAALVLLFTCLSALAAGSAVAATPGEAATFPIASPCPVGRIAAAPQEGVLIRECERRGTSEQAPIGNLLPSGQLVGLADLESPAGPLLAGPSGEVWVATNVGGYSKEPVGIARIAPDGSVQRFPFPAQGMGAEMRPEVRDMVIGRDGALWAAVADGGTANPEWYFSVGGEIARIAPDGTITEYPTPVGIEPRALTLGVEGDLWFTAISELSATEHTFHAGTGHIGRMTTTGEYTIFPTPIAHSNPGAIAAAPDGTLWFAENGSIGTIRPDGTFGPGYQSLAGSNRSLAFGPEGDLWAAGTGLVRLTPAGQRTAFGLAAGDAVIGREGNVWAESFKSVSRLVPGAPGLDVWGLEADPQSKTATVTLACGGSPSGCKGTLEVTLPRVIKRSGQKRNDWKHSTYRMVRRGYSVPAESSRKVRFDLSATALAIAAHYGREHRGSGTTATIEATVAGGPAMHRKTELRRSSANAR